jgi:hypothetical protein
MDKCICVPTTQVLSDSPTTQRSEVHSHSDVCPCPPGFAANPNTLSQGSSLTPAPGNWGLLVSGTYLLSASGTYILVFQGDGNLVVGGML